MHRCRYGDGGAGEVGALEVAGELSSLAPLKLEKSALISVGGERGLGVTGFGPVETRKWIPELDITTLHHGEPA